jgi:hypothetical protein
VVGLHRLPTKLSLRRKNWAAKLSLRSKPGLAAAPALAESVCKKANEVRAHAMRTLTMKVGQFPVEAALVEEKMDIVTAKDFLCAGKLTRWRRCDRAQALVSRLGNRSMIKIERKVKAKVGSSP